MTTTFCKRQWFILNYQSNTMTFFLTHNPASCLIHTYMVQIPFEANLLLPFEYKQNK